MIKVVEKRIIANNKSEPECIKRKERWLKSVRKENKVKMTRNNEPQYFGSMHEYLQAIYKIVHLTSYEDYQISLLHLQK